MINSFHYESHEVTQVLELVKRLSPSKLGHRFVHIGSDDPGRTKKAQLIHYDADVDLLTTRQATRSHVRV